eukprot:m.196725 g.196725  ORF g.196725 m.196725 type:complete len:311 (-) comp18332_c0_seq4:29-961(-)
MSEDATIAKLMSRIASRAPSGPSTPPRPSGGGGGGRRQSSGGRPSSRGGPSPRKDGKRRTSSATSANGGGHGLLPNPAVAAAPEARLAIPGGLGDNDGTLPLEYVWSYWYDERAKAFANKRGGAAQGKAYGANLRMLGSPSTVEAFWRYFNHLVQPSAMEINANFHFFKHGIRPMWEDAQNKQGGKWVLTIKNDTKTVDQCWKSVLVGLISGVLDDGDNICGAVVSRRAKGDRIAVWTRDKQKTRVDLAIGKRVLLVTDVKSKARHFQFEFQFHSDALKTGASFSNSARFKREDAESALDDPSVPGLLAK